MIEFVWSWIYRYLTSNISETVRMKEGHDRLLTLGLWRSFQYLAPRTEKDILTDLRFAWVNHELSLCTSSKVVFTLQFIKVRWEIRGTTLIDFLCWRFSIRSFRLKSSHFNSFRRRVIWWNFLALKMNLMAWLKAHLA